MYRKLMAVLVAVSTLTLGLSVAPVAAYYCNPNRINDFDTVHRRSFYDTTGDPNKITGSIRASGVEYIDGGDGNANYLLFDLKDYNGQGLARVGWKDDAYSSRPYFYLRDATGAIRKEIGRSYDSSLINQSKVTLWTTDGQDWHFRLYNSSGSLIEGHDWDIIFDFAGFTPTRAGVSFSMHSKGNQWFGSSNGNWDVHNVQVTAPGIPTHELGFYGDDVVESENSFSGMNYQWFRTDGDVVVWDGNC